MKNKIFLAPIAGVTDRAFREIGADFGAACVFTEMVSIRGLYYNDKKTEKLLSHGNYDVPEGVQIFGNEPEIFHSVAKKALSYGGSFIDVNMGCPMPKIVNNGDGSALMKDTKRIYEIITAIKEAVNVPVSIKIRKGWDNSCVNAVEVAKIAQQAGADFITVHGRTKSQLYSGVADWDIIKEVVENVSIPVIGNGDIFVAEDSEKMLKYTGCAAVMVARGTMGNPWLIRDCVEYLKSGIVKVPPTATEKMEVAIKQLRKMVEYKGEINGVKEFRKNALWYVKGMNGATKIKNLITSAHTFEQMLQILSNIL